MKTFGWNEPKNRWLLRERGVTFERIILRIEQGGLLDILRHPNAEKYPGQQLFVIEINGYAWLVPYVESDTEIFLKTAIPSRKATRKYLRGKQ
jgi:hypothetical protein